ncbi:hypothetical protein EVA_18749 [gut metagenome]|uniref:Uncharacterized protein n=1 Tax=gut metagenome TaxID=749906 RepID=J9FE19_9ZZZZ
MIVLFLDKFCPLFVPREGIHFITVTENQLLRYIKFILCG